jgi:hypothetical protein
MLSIGTFETDLTGALTVGNESEQLLQWPPPSSNHIAFTLQKESFEATASASIEIFQPESVWLAEMRSMKELVEVEPDAKCKL